MSNIKIIKNKKRRQTVTPDPKKESVIKELASLAESKGFSVKRENLKQGIGWKVMSGVCRFNDDRLIFVDRKLSQSDQISFLLNKCLSIGLQENSEELSSVSPIVKQMFAASPD